MSWDPCLWRPGTWCKKSKTFLPGHLERTKVCVVAHRPRGVPSWQQPLPPAMWVSAPPNDSCTRLSHHFQLLSLASWGCRYRAEKSCSTVSFLNSWPTNLWTELNDWLKLPNLRRIYYAAVGTERNFNIMIFGFSYLSQSENKNLSVKFIFLWLLVRLNTLSEHLPVVSLFCLVIILSPFFIDSFPFGSVRILCVSRILTFFLLRVPNILLLSFAVVYGVMYLCLFFSQAWIFSSSF